MSAPQVVQVTPNNEETDVVLGQALSVTFDQVIDTTTLNDDTFSLTCPAPTQILTNTQLISGEAAPSAVSVPGTWSFVVDDQNRTVATFTPTDALLQNTPYTATLFGADAALSTQDVMNPTQEAMANSYQWSFITGILQLTVPPVVSPLIDANPPINLKEIRVVPRMRRPLGQDLSQEFDIIFPDDIDPTSFDPSDLYMSIEPLLGDPNAIVPPGLEYSATVSGNKLQIKVTGWPAS